MNRFKPGLGITHSGKRKCINATLSPRKYKPIEPGSLVIAGKINSILCVCTFIHRYMCMHAYKHVYIFICIHINMYNTTYACTEIKTRVRQTTYLLSNHNSGYYNLTLHYNETFSNDGLITSGQSCP